MLNTEQYIDTTIEQLSDATTCDVLTSAPMPKQTNPTLKTQIRFTGRTRSLFQYGDWQVLKLDLADKTSNTPILLDYISYSLLITYYTYLILTDALVDSPDYSHRNRINIMWLI